MSFYRFQQPATGIFTRSIATGLASVATGPVSVSPNLQYSDFEWVEQRNFTSERPSSPRQLHYEHAALAIAASGWQTDWPPGHIGDVIGFGV